MESVKTVKPADEFAGELDVGDLVFADRDEEAFAGFGVHDNVGGLQGGVAEKAVGVEVFILDVVELFLVGGDAFEPAEGVIMERRRWSSACSGTRDCRKMTDFCGSRPEARKSMVICREFSAMAEVSA